MSFAGKLASMVRLPILIFQWFVFLSILLPFALFPRFFTISVFPFRVQLLFTLRTILMLIFLLSPRNFELTPLLQPSSSFLSATEVIISSSSSVYFLSAFLPFLRSCHRGLIPFFSSFHTPTRRHSFLPPVQKF